MPMLFYQYSLQYANRYGDSQTMKQFRSIIVFYISRLDNTNILIIENCDLVIKWWLESISSQCTLKILVMCSISSSFVTVFSPPAPLTSSEWASLYPRAFFTNFLNLFLKIIDLSINFNTFTFKFNDITSLNSCQNQCLA